MSSQLTEYRIIPGQPAPCAAAVDARNPRLALVGRPKMLLVEWKRVSAPAEANVVAETLTAADLVTRVSTTTTRCGWLTRGW
jgi:hypothetical protein